MLGNHIHIVGVATKNIDGHSKEVRTIRDITELKGVDKEAHTPDMLAYIFGHILMDPHQYFNTFTGKPRSNLSVLREILRLFVVPTTMHCPIKDLMGSQNDKRGRKEEGDGHAMSNGRGSDKRQKIGEIGGENPNWIKKLQSQGKRCRKLKPDYKIEYLFKSYPTLQLSELRIGSPGTCQDYHLFGE